MRIALGGDEHVAEFVGKKLGVAFHPPFTCMGVVDDEGLLIGGAVFNGYNGFNIDFSMYAPGMVNKRFMRAFFDYPFNQLGVLRLSARTRRANKRVCDLLTRLGFKFEGVADRYFGPQRRDDAMCYALHKDKALSLIGKL